MEKHKFKGPYEVYFKRLLDILVSLVVLVGFSWLYIAIALLVRLKLGSPVIFTQKRPGRIDHNTGEEIIFKLYKYRSMTDKRDEQGHLLPGKERMTPFGAKLRATSLDELPEILNILKGDMSFIGPRPLAIQYLPYYTEQERKRHTVRPGLTGLAQASGRNNLSWEEKFKYDVEYANNVTLKMDLRILLKTVKAVLSHEGIGQGEQTPENFDDYRKRQIEMRQ